MTEFKKKIWNYTSGVVLWFGLALLTGALTGIVGAGFHHAVEWATETREAHPWLLYFLPAGGVLIALLYRLSKEPLNTNTVIDSIRSGHPMSALLAPLIFISSVITHLFGGSAGREGAALQIGGGIGAQLGRILRLNEERMGILIVCGMAGAFSAIFTTPVTAAVFALEVVSVGHIRYFQLMPCMISSICAYLITLWTGNPTLAFHNVAMPAIDVWLSVQVFVLAILTALVGIFYCVALHSTERLMHKFLKYDCFISLVGGGLIVLLTLLLHTHDYNGAGMNVIHRALDGQAVSWAFLCKLLFTAITIGAGFKGGEIVPALFIGATFGAAASGLLGLPAPFAAAIGMLCMFCSITNCPLASIFMGVELFGGSGSVFFALACGVSYVISGHYGLYRSQRIVYSKLGVSKNQ